MKRNALAAAVALLVAACTTTIERDVLVSQGAALGSCGDDASADATTSDAPADVAADTTTEAGDDSSETGQDSAADVLAETASDAPADGPADAAPDAVLGCDGGLAAPPTGTSNAWVATTLPGWVSGDYCQSVVLDPVNPGTLVLSCGNNDGRAIKVYRSTDYAATAVELTVGPMHGDPWGMTGDPNPTRDPCSPLTLYSPAGYSSMGIWKSVDGGTTWARLTGADTAFSPYSPYGPTDIYEVVVLPDNPPNHLVATWHGNFKNSNDAGLGESIDGGLTWTIHPPPAGFGTSHYLWAASATTWTVVAQDNNGANGIWHTTTGGRINGVPSTAAWQRTCAAGEGGIGTDCEHVHGSFTQLYVAGADGGGELYFPTWRTMVRSADQGASWIDIFAQSGRGGDWHTPPNPAFRGVQTSGLTATRTYAYSSFLLGSSAADHGNARAALSAIDDAAAWYQANVDAGPGSWLTTMPSGMNSTGSNPLGMAAACAPNGGCVVLQATNSGLYRMVE